MSCTHLIANHLYFLNYSTSCSIPSYQERINAQKVSQNIMDDNRALIFNNVNWSGDFLPIEGSSCCEGGRFSNIESIAQKANLGITYNGTNASPTWEEWIHAHQPRKFNQP